MPDIARLEKAYRLIKEDNREEARRALAELLRDEPKNAGAWALAAWIAPDASRSETCLRRVFEESGEAALADWAMQELARLKDGGLLSAMPEPPIGWVTESATGVSGIASMTRTPAASPGSAAGQPSAPASVPLTRKPLVAEDEEAGAGGLPFSLAEIGGFVSIVGVVIIVLTAFIRPLFDLVAGTGILPGWIACALIALGLVLTLVGRTQMRSKKPPRR